MPTATTKNTGATMSVASARRRLVAVPLRIRRNDTIAGMIAIKHSSIPNGATAGMTASSAPRMAMTNVTAPRRLRGDRRWSAFIRSTSFPSLPHSCRSHASWCYRDTWSANDRAEGRDVGELLDDPAPPSTLIAWTDANTVSPDMAPGVGSTNSDHHARARHRTTRPERTKIIVSESSAEKTRPSHTSRSTPIRRRSSAAPNNTPKCVDARVNQCSHKRGHWFNLRCPAANACPFSPLRPPASAHCVIDQQLVMAGSKMGSVMY
jgi:hypothetical protein